MAFGALALTVAALVPAAPGSAAFAIVLAGAAAWQLSPLKRRWLRDCHRSVPLPPRGWARSEEHTSELQSHHDLVCRILLEKKKLKKKKKKQTKKKNTKPNTKTKLTNK